MPLRSLPDVVVLPQFQKFPNAFSVLIHANASTALCGEAFPHYAAPSERDGGSERAWSF